jgi:fatty acid desaturase
MAAQIDIDAPGDARERDSMQLAKLVLLWALWLLAIAGVDRLVAVGPSGVAAGAFLGFVTGVLVVAGIGFIGHDIAHGSVVSGERAMRAGAFFSLTAVLFVPYFLWVRWHNAFHHRYANTPRDSDRLLREEEIDAGLASYRVYRITNLLGLSLQYVATRVWRTLYRSKGFGDRKKRADVLSLLAIASLYAVAFAVLGPATFALGVALPVTASLVTVSYYIQSNHFDRPLTAKPHPVRGSSDVSVPGLVDFLHSNFSRHTAHHVFPSVPSRHYPGLTAQIRAKYPADYRCTPFLVAAWRSLTLPKIVRDGRFLVDRRGAVRRELT